LMRTAPTCAAPAKSRVIVVGGGLAGMLTAYELEKKGITCTVIEAFNAPTCNCAAEPGRSPALDSLLTDEMRRAGNCFCEILQLRDSAQRTCKTNLNPPANAGNGWCYVDPAQQSDATCDVVRDCSTDQQRQIRFINTNSEPRPGATAFLRCEARPIAPLPSRCP